MYRRICGEYGVAPDYFMRSMGFAEASDFVEGASDRCKTLWQATRMLMYTNVAVMGGAKNKTPRDIMPLPWDEAEERLSDEAVEALRAKAQNIANILNNKDDGGSNS